MIRNLNLWSIFQIEKYFLKKQDLTVFEKSQS